MPKLSILMPVYNAMPYLPKAVQSILAQNYKDFELIIINDGSNDNSLKYLNNLNDSRIIILNKEKSGIVNSLNYGLSIVKGIYVGRMDGDDICSTNKFEKQINFLIQNHHIVCVGTSINYISQNGKKSGFPIFMPITHREIIKTIQNRKSAMIHPTILVRKEILLKIGGYRNDAIPVEDYDLFIRLSQEGELANIPSIEYSIRLHKNSTTANSIITGQKKFDEILLKYYGTSKQNNLTKIFDYYSVHFYKLGLRYYLNTKIPILGIIILIFSAILSPKRAILYLKRKLLLSNF